MHVGTQVGARDDTDFEVWTQLGLKNVCADPPANPHDWTLQYLKDHREKVAAQRAAGASPVAHDGEDLFVPIGLEANGAWGENTRRVFKELVEMADRAKCKDLYHWSAGAWGEHWKQRIGRSDWSSARLLRVRYVHELWRNESLIGTRGPSSRAARRALSDSRLEQQG